MMMQKIDLPALKMEDKLEATILSFLDDIDNGGMEFHMDFPRAMC